MAFFIRVLSFCCKFLEKGVFGDGLAFFPFYSSGTVEVLCVLLHVCVCRTCPHVRQGRRVVFCEGEGVRFSTDLGPDLW